ncbi:uncharacterized protein LOC112554507 isoform X2 [Pomacea canaliculata]|uniref:uncharacterized protein LOC112554507 isoform X2 n=1 Tax=Pomacea canaliculata TaxID=400727 RepID=UPI000D72B978|nr:uncharacterized protein LOC112554507 isoform X2 [Pomacea canaliculata]
MTQMVKQKNKLFSAFVFTGLCLVGYVCHTADAEETPVRLRDGEGANEGRVEILKNGVWVSLCRPLISGYVAEAICEQLGFSRDGAQMYYGNSYGPAPGETYRGSVYCGYSDFNLSSCMFGAETTTCDPQDALGISCNTSTSASPNVRLVGGNSLFEGRVEVFRNGVWGTVTYIDDLYGPTAANVICRHLHGNNYGGSVISKQESAIRFDIAKYRAIVMQNIACNGNETNILDCPYTIGLQGSYSSYYPDHHEDDLAIVCKIVPEGCNGYTISEKGRLTIPRSLTTSVYSYDIDCVWRIDTLLNNAQIKLSVEGEISSASNKLRVFNNRRGFSVSNHMYENYFSDIESPGTITIDSNIMYLWLQTPAGSKGITFSVLWDVGCSFSYSSNQETSFYISSPGYPGPFPENLNCSYVITYREGLTTSLTFNSLGLSSAQGGLCSDYVQIFDGGSEMSPTLCGPYCGTQRPEPVDLTNSSSFTVTILFRSDGKSNASAHETGFQIYFRQFEPAALTFGPYSASSGTLSTPGYPNVYNGEADIIWTITTKPYTTITLLFQDVQSNDYLYVSSYGYIYNNGRVGPIITDSNSASIRLYSRYGNNINKVLFNWTTECRQVIHSQQGIISSPDDPEFDSAYATCSYIISETQGYYVSLVFSSIDLAKDTQCFSYIKMFDGTNNYSPMIGQQLCSSSQPPLTRSSTANQMMIEFKRDELNGLNSSFEASYSTHSKECGNWLLTDGEGFLESPGYPLLFPANTYCNWTITVKEGFVVVLKFEDFNVGQQATDCQNAIVKLYDGNTTDADRVIGTYCGNQLVPTVNSTSNSLTVVLNAFSSAYTGFRASYRQVKDLSTSLDLLQCGPGVDNVCDTKASDSQEIDVQEGFPFGDKARHKIYLGQNGIVSFDYNNQWPVLEPTSLSICVYCALMKTSNVCRTGTSGVYYKIYKGTMPSAISGLIKEAGSLLKLKFSPAVLLVFTWKCMEQDFQSYHPNNPGQATFQLILASDWTTSYAFTLYSLTEMNWKYYGPWYPIQIGITQGSRENFQQNVYSKSEYAYHMSTYLGNTGHKGIWVYKVGEIPSSDGRLCDEWYLRNQKLEAVRSEGFAKLPPCPCSKDDIYNGVANQWRYFRKDEDNHLECFILNLATTRRYAPFSKECCYFFGNQTLIQAIPLAGPSLAYTPLLYELRKQYEIEDVQAYRTCCFNSTDQRCQKFYQLRPIGKCDSDIAYQRSTLYGDPHIKTLDEREYNYNGIGEINLITIRTPQVNFTLQGRTERTWDDKGVPSNGTVFTALGMEENGVKVFVGIDPSTNTSLIVYASGVDYTLAFRKDFTLDTENFMIRSFNDTCTVSFPSGIGIQTSVRLQALASAFNIPNKFSSLPKGMFGNFNGNISDDFVLPNGDTLGNNLTEREIFNKFSPKWFVTKNDTVMHYEPRMGPSDYSHPEFTPVFLDEAPTTDHSNAVKACGADNKPCIYDYIATGKQDFALETSSLRNQSEVILRQIKNSLPVISAPDKVSVTMNQTAQFTVSAHDDDNDVVTLHLVEDYNGVLKINSSTGTVTLSLTTLDIIQISVYVVDSNGGYSPLTFVPLIVCTGCGGHGKCNTAKVRPSSGNFYFQHAVCECQPAWDGEDCQLDKDGCAGNPCHPKQNCSDIPAETQGNNSVGYTCSACPQGFVNDRPASCSDINECADRSLSHCEMLCNNTYGGYLCYCQPGYRLNADGLKCSDINECLDKTDDCQQICNNTDGGYTCSCHEGYIYNPVSNLCEEDQSLKTICQNSGCSQNCRARNDSSTYKSIPECFCNAGFDVDPKDNKTCQDHDECQDHICAQLCSNTQGSFSCSCNNGYMLNDDKRTCSACPYLRYGFECRQMCQCNDREERCDNVKGCICKAGWTGSECQDDVDECAENPHICRQDQTCANIPGSYSCLCHPGYMDDGNGTCIDINECESTFPCETQHEECRNFAGGFYCTCIKGYMKAGNHCVDVDECELKIAECQHDCINVPGSFNCRCRYGYRLEPDRRNCSKVRDVCAAFNKTTCKRAHGCTLDDNDKPVCICDSGYELSTDHESCQDIDECRQGGINCSHNCTNMNGGFECSCPLGMKLDEDYRTCINCTPGTYGEGCAKDCSCGAGSDYCDVKIGCVCKDGWAGHRCDQDIDECTNSSILQQCKSEKKQCVNLDGGYKCKCQSGYFEGVNGTCSDINECEKSPCDQSCHNTLGSYQCDCRAGFFLNKTTNRCYDVDECSDHNVSRCSQECHNTPGSYRCTCKTSGYSLDNDGVTCIDINECTNGLARCAAICKNTDGGYVCSCPAGEILDPDGLTCKSCPNGTYGIDCNHTCNCGQRAERCDKETGCVCRPGWQGTDCDTDIDECHNQDVIHKCTLTNAICVNSPGTYTCKCDVGFSLDQGGICKDIDECRSSPCSLQCINTNGSYICTCDTGFIFDNTTKDCKDIDECLSSPCNQVCINTNGSYTCACNNGFTLNAANGKCEDINECLSSPCSQRCVNTDGSYTCTCYNGFMIDNTTRTCKDVDECLDSPCSQVCINTNGSYTCACNNGFTLNTANRTCEDIDECLSSPCSQVCINTNGSYTCACNNGFTLNAANGKCEDINECLSSPCSQRCVNTDGGYICSCYNGFMFDNTTRTCDDVDECLDSPCSQVCINTNGSYTCACNNGFTLNTANRTCEDINECLSSPCSQRCVNTDGGYTCTCYNGFMFDSTTGTCLDVDECFTSPCSQVCINTNGSYTCACNNGFTLNTANRTCEDINECLSSPCSQRCVNTDGSYSCTCDSGFVLDTASGKCEDIDECRSYPCSQVCINTVGNYICTCNRGFLLDRNNGQCEALITVSVTISVNVNVIPSDLANKSGTEYGRWKQSVTQQLSLYFSETLVGFQFLEVTSLRAGSIIADADIFMKSSSEASAKSSLAVALSSLTSSVFCLRQQTGDLQVAYQNHLINQHMTKCQVFEYLNPCEQGMECDPTEEFPMCREVKNSTPWLVIGLAAGIPAGLSLLLIAVCPCIARHLRKKKHSKVDEPDIPLEDNPSRQRSRSLDLNIYTSLRSGSSSIPRPQIT